MAGSRAKSSFSAKWQGFPRANGGSFAMGHWSPVAQKGDGMMRFSGSLLVKLVVGLSVPVLLSACGGSSSSPPAASWAGTRQLGVAGAVTAANSVATDASGNVYVAGYTSGGLDGNTLTGTDDCFLTKYDSKGARQFTRQLGAVGASTTGMSVATDSAGNVYVAGYTGGDLDGNTLAGAEDFFLTKYDSTGVKLFTKQLGVAGASTTGYAVAIDPNDNVYVAGSTSGGLDGNALTGTSDLFVTKYDSSGAKLFTRQLGVAGYTTAAYSVATDSNGNVYVAGYTTGGLDGNTLTGTEDCFVTMYDSNGVKQGTLQQGVAGATTDGSSVATDANGNVYVAGITNGDLDGNTLTGTWDFFVTKYDSSGAKLFTRQLGATGAKTYGGYVATDSGGNVYVAGTTRGGLDGNAPTGTDDLFLTKYDSSGAKQFTRQLGVAGAATVAAAVATDPGDNVFVAGQTTAGLDGNTLVGMPDCFVTKYNSSGVKQ